MQAILDQWQRLILPPAGVAVRAGEQSDERGGDIEVPPGQVLLRKHLAGMATYAVELAWPDPANGTPMAKAGVIEVPAIETAQALHRAAAAAGVQAALAWTGDPGAQLWVFSEPVPAAAMGAALRRLRASLPEDSAQPPGGLVPVDRPRVVLPPGWRGRSRGWAYFHRPDEAPTAVDSEVIPSGLLDHQLEVLAPVAPTGTDVLLGFAAGTAPIRPESAAPDAAPAEPVSFAPVTLADEDGAPLRLVVAGAAGEPVTVDLAPLQALALAAALVEGARRRLS